MSDEIIERELVPLEVPPEDFIPSEQEIQRATALRDEFVSNGEAIDTLFERQVRILLELHRDPRLCKALDYENVWEFLRDPEVMSAMRVRVGSQEQLYRLVRLAEIDERFPKVQILREPHLSRLTHTGALAQLEGLNPSQEEEAEKIVEEVRGATIQKLNQTPLPEVRTDKNTVLIDGEPALRVPRFSTLAIRAISRIYHAAPAPSFEIQERKIVAWHDDVAETVLEIVTTDERVIEYIRERLAAKRV